jgi:phage/plasmid-like protein (TIGR03299 family)
MGYSGSTPWHGLGARFGMRERFDVRAAFESAGLTWEPETRKVYDEFGRHIEGARLVSRGDTHAHIGIVGDAYRSVGNGELAAALDPIVAEGLAHVEVCGSLRGGADVWALLKLHTSGVGMPGDDVESYILAHNNHSGRKSLTFAYTPVRVVCANTLHAAEGSRDLLGRIRHTSGASARITELAEAVTDAERATRRAFERLASVRVSEDAARSVLSRAGASDKAADEAIARAINGIGTDGAITGWSLYNGSTEYETHIVGKNSESRALRTLYGQGFSARVMSDILAMT